MICFMTLHNDAVNGYFLAHWKTFNDVWSFIDSRRARRSVAKLSLYSSIKQYLMHLYWIGVSVSARWSLEQ